MARELVSVEKGQRPVRLINLKRPGVVITAAPQGMRGVDGAAGVAGAAGPPGVDGATGQSAVPSVFYFAGETLSGHRAVYINGGLAYYADKDDASSDAVLGITLTSALISTQVEIRYVGVVTEPSWSWTPGDPVYLGSGGMLTQTVPLTGALVELGVALTPTSLNVRIQEAIYLG